MPGKIKNCPSCGRLYQDFGKHLCPDCLRKQEEKEREVVDYVRDNPDSKIPEICEATGAKESMIKRLIREGRFIQVGVQLSYPCEKCGAPIITGKFCPKCMEEMQKELQSQTKKMMASVPPQRSDTGRGGLYSMRGRK